MRCELLLVFGSAEKGRHYPVKVSGVEIVPDPVERGVPATFKISATTGKPLSGRNLCMLLFPCVFAYLGTLFCHVFGPLVRALEEITNRELSFVVYQTYMLWANFVCSYWDIVSSLK